jgi:hypothetical protein
MPTQDIAAALASRIAELDAEMKRLGEERERAARALAALTVTNRSGNIDHMEAFERVKHSKGRAANPETRKLRAACNAKQLSIRDLAAKARKETRHKKVTHAHLSYAADGSRPIDLDLAQWIAKQIDYPATKANWEKLRGE